MMEYFYTLSDNDRDMAMHMKAHELLDMWIDENIQETGDELPNLAEEGLLQMLDEANGTKLIEEAKEFYAELEKEENNVQQN